MEWITSPEAWIALASLTALELVLGIDNVLFIAILAGRLPPEKQALARRLGLGAGMIMRILLLFAISWVIGLTEPLFTVLDNAISGRDIILIGGGLFLLAKATHEIHDKLEGPSDQGRHGARRKAVSMASVLVQIALLDVVFSLDSVITAVGMVDEIAIMVIAIVIAVACMMAFAGPISRFVEKHPTVKILALSFLLLIGMALVADGLDVHVPRGYIYFAIGFSVLVEVLNLRMRKVSGEAEPAPPVQLHEPSASNVPEKS